MKSVEAAARTAANCRSNKPACANNLATEVESLDMSGGCRPLDQLRRPEASGKGWQEHFVDEAQASASSSMGSAVAQSLSYVTIDNFASLEERKALETAALNYQKSEEDRIASLLSPVEDHAEDGSKEVSGSHIMFASEANHNCTRYSVQTLLSERAKTISLSLHQRLLQFLERRSEGEDKSTKSCSDDDDNAIANLATEVFGTNENLQSMRAVWYAEPDEKGVLHPEPKVNIYHEGGFFKRHEDGMSLTLLIVLNSEFEGGGTAFFSTPVGGNYPNTRTEGVSQCATCVSEGKASGDQILTAKPPAGTAMMWGGGLEHMALPVTKGMRSVFVGSFDLV